MCFRKKNEVLSWEGFSYSHIWSPAIFTKSWSLECVSRANSPFFFDDFMHLVFPVWKKNLITYFFFVDQISGILMTDDKNSPPPDFPWALSNAGARFLNPPPPTWIKAETRARWRNKKRLKKTRTLNHLIQVGGGVWLEILKFSHRRC